jgi:hypothetical protein
MYDDVEHVRAFVGWLTRSPSYGAFSRKDLTELRFEINSENMEYFALMGDKYGVKALLNDVRVHLPDGRSFLIYIYSTTQFVVSMTK